MLALDYIHAIAEGSGDYGRFLTTSAGTTTTLVTSALTNSTLTATEFATMTALVETDACAGQQASILGGGLDRSTGTLTVGDAYTDAVASGVYFSLYRLLAPLREQASPSILSVINEALREYLWVEDTISLAGVTGQHYYAIDTDTYWWWTDPRRIIEVRRPTTASDDVPLALNTVEWDWDHKGETKRLVLPTAPFLTGETFGVKVYRPANSRLRLRATARATVAAGAVTAITVVLPGYYASTPTVTISGGGGTGATATATITSGAVTAIAVGNGGSGYTTPPTVTVSAGSWNDQTSPMAELLGIGDEAISDVNDVKVAGLWRYYLALAALAAPGATVAEWMLKAEAWGQQAALLEHVGEPSNRRTNVAAIRPVLVGGVQSSTRWR